jgi:hypothetical protein
MVAKCANPACATRFRYFREGRLFQVDRKGDAGAHNGGKNGHNVEYFWLCAACALSHALAVDGNGRVEVLPQPVLRPRAA